MATTPTKPITIELENLTRSVYCFPLPGKDGGFFRLGDKADTDDNIPDGLARDPVFQPQPVQALDPDAWAKLGETNQKVIADLVRQGLIRLRELAT